MAFRENVDFGAVRVRDLKVNGKAVPISASFTIAAGSSNVAGITITLKDYMGTALTNAAIVDIWLSGAATGLGLGTAPSTGFAVTTGTLLNAYSSKLAIRAMSDASGVIVLTLTDTGKATNYVAVGGNGGTILSVSRILATGDYG